MTSYLNCYLKPQNLTLVQELLYDRSHNLEAWVTLNMHQIFVSLILVISSTVQTDFFFSQVQKVPSRANQLPDNSWQNFGIIQKRQFVMPLKNCGGSPCATLCRKISILEFHISYFIFRIIFQIFGIS